MREEVVSSLILDVLDRRTRFNDLPQKVKPAITRAYAMFPEKGAHASLDAQIFGDGDTTLGDRIDSTVFRF